MQIFCLNIIQGLNLFKKRHLLFLVFFNLTVCFAAPPDNGLQGRLIFLGVNHNSTNSVWLSLTTAAGSFQLEGPGKQLIDEWTKDQRGLRLSLSPTVSQGNGGTHHLINATNNKKLDSQNQQGGIVFPPFPSWPPGIPTHPIVLPGTPTHPIVIPGTPTHPIVLPGTPTHPIVIPPGSSGTPTHPIVIPPGSSGTPTHPIVIPPGSAPPEGIASSGSNYSSQNEMPGNFEQLAPITSARQFDEDAWNVWSDNYYFGIRDGRNDVDTSGHATNFTVGADRHITNRLIGGLSLSTVHLNATAYNGGLENNVRGYKAGPYLGYRLSPKWAINGFVNFGRLKNQNIISTLNSQYATTLVNATLQAIGLYQFGAFQIRPQPLISYNYFRNPTYDFNGTIGTVPVQITRQAEHFTLGVAELKFENNYTFETKKGNLIQPYNEVGVDYAFARPSDDQIYSGNLALGNVPQVSGLFTLGLRTIYENKLMIQASGSYLSIGASGLDLWDARLLISYLFS